MRCIFAAVPMPVMRIPLRCLFAAALCGPVIAAAQAGNLANGLVLHNDSTFAARFHFRMQNRADFRHTVGSREVNLDLLVRRFRLKLEGHVLTPRLGYKIQLGFAQGDMDVGDGLSAPNPLIDAVVEYALAHHTVVAFGQAKMPGGREALISSGELELPERPIANSAYTLDRDRGLQLRHQLPLNGRPVRATVAMTEGEGRSEAASGNGLCYTGRLEWMPLGDFAGNGAYSEGDLLREPKPRLAVAAAYSSDRQARLARAQRGPVFPDGGSRTIGTFFTDALFKCQGWALMAEYAQRQAGGVPAVMDLADSSLVYVNEGWGLTNQLSRMLGKRSQVAVRWSMVRADASVHQDYSDRDEAMLGFSHYLNAHRVKLQTALYYNWGNGQPDFAHAGNFYGLLLQVELGI